MSENPLTLRKTVIGGETFKNDYCVYFEGRSVGRIMLTEDHVKHIVIWRWHVNPPLPITDWANGSAPDFEAAKAAFRDAWERFYAGLTPEDIRHWHETDAACKRG